MPNWGVEVRYDTQNDLLYVRRWSQDLLGARGPTTETSFGPYDVEDVLALVQTVVRTKGAPRFF